MGMVALNRNSLLDAVILVIRFTPKENKSDNFPQQCGSQNNCHNHSDYYGKIKAYLK